MKRIVLLSCLLGLVAGCEPQAAPQQATSPPVSPSPAQPAQPAALPEGAVQGDFDGDGTLEYVWLVPPEVDSTGESCVGECVSYLTSSNPALKRYALDQSLGGELTTFHHLGAERRDYVGILPSWFTSCWSDYHVLTYRAGGWQYGVRPFSTHCDQWEADEIPIMADSAHAGYVLIHYSEFAHDSITTKTKSVPLK
ncbi:MAG: hypothetical protein ACRYFZ_04040 [Janthinobacterium lividum]